MNRQAASRQGGSYAKPNIAAATSGSATREQRSPFRQKFEHAGSKERKPAAIEQQIAAIRRNAVKSTGPRSSAGKRRARLNSYRHGLSTSAAGRSKMPEQVERLAREIAAGVGANAGQIL